MWAKFLENQSVASAVEKDHTQATEVKQIQRGIKRILQFIHSRVRLRILLPMHRTSAWSARKSAVTVHTARSVKDVNVANDVSAVSSVTAAVRTVILRNARSCQLRSSAPSKLRQATCAGCAPSADICWRHTVATPLRMKTTTNMRTCDGVKSDVATVGKNVDDMGETLLNKTSFILDTQLQESEIFSRQKTNRPTIIRHEGK